jgi:hypothetical protein
MCTLVCVSACVCVCLLCVCVFPRSLVCVFVSILLYTVCAQTCIYSFFDLPVRLCVISEHFPYRQATDVPSNNLHVDSVVSLPAALASTSPELRKKGGTLAKMCRRLDSNQEYPPLAHVLALHYADMSFCMKKKSYLVLKS